MEYIQENYNIEDILKYLGFDSTEQAEKSCGRSIYALEADMCDGEIGTVYACHDYSANGKKTLLTADTGRLTFDHLENIEYFRTGDSQVIYQFCVDYYGGQNSRGYKLLCGLQKRLKKMLGEVKYRHIFNSEAIYNDLRASTLYNFLVKNYSEKI